MWQILRFLSTLHFADICEEGDDISHYADEEFAYACALACIRSPHTTAISLAKCRLAAFKSPHCSIDG